MNEREFICPRCGTKGKEYYYSDYGIGEVERHFECDYCNYFEEFAYGNSREVDDLSTYETYFLPCRPGTKIYRIYTRSWIGEDIVKEWIIDETGINYIDQNNRMTPVSVFGYRVFTDKEKAEEILNELKQIDNKNNEPPFI